MKTTSFLKRSLCFFLSLTLLGLTSVVGAVALPPEGCGEEELSDLTLLEDTMASPSTEESISLTIEETMLHAIIMAKSPTESIKGILETAGLGLIPKINYMDEEGRTALDLVEDCDSHLYHLLKSHGAHRSIDLRLLYGVAQRDQKTVAELLCSGADPTVVNEEGDTCLHLIARHGATSLLPLFFRHRSEEEAKEAKKDNGVFLLDVNVINHAGKTPLQVALEHSKEPIVQELLAYGGDLGRKPADDKLCTALEANKKACAYLQKYGSLPIKKCLQTLEGHTHWVISVAYHPRREQLASGSDDNTVKIWDIATRACLRTLEGHTNSVYSVAYHPRGEQLASGSWDKTINIWDIRKGACLRTLEGHTHWVRSVAYHPRGEQLVSGSGDNTIKIWDVERGACLRTLEGHANTVYAVAYHPRGEQLASGSGDNTVKIWDIATGRCLSTLVGHTQPIRSVAYASNGAQLASGSMDRTVKIWDIATGRCLSTLAGHTDLVISVAYTSNGRQLASGSADKTVKIWDIATGRCLSTLAGHTSYVWSVAYASSGQLASGSADKSIKIWGWEYPWEEEMDEEERKE